MKPKFRTEGDSFIIENYNHAPPFSSFFPALAGETGKPMWVFYTNRGQGISSFGVNNKDGSMLEFLPANKAYQATPTLGFRTFIRTGKKSDSWYEPFAIRNTDSQQTLTVRPYDFEIKEVNKSLGIEVKVHYFGVPNETCPVLARRLSISNISKKSLTLSVVDGLPRIVPWGMGDYLVKNMSRTIEAFAEVANDRNTVPYFKLKVEPADRPDVQKLQAGFFSFTLRDQELLPIIVDPAVVFGMDSSFVLPSSHFGTNGFSYDKQLTSNIMPSSFFSSTVTLKPKASREWESYFGHTGTSELANAYSEKIKSVPNYFEKKHEEIKDVYTNLVNRFGLKTSNPVLDAYANNTFMDNVLRGGFPLSFGPNSPIIHVYSRKHGDMERDYNTFQVSATYYSQGNGNFRDVNQNRRHDILLNPLTKTTNIDFFFNLIQLDGYNPLVINPLCFIIPKDLIHHPEFKVTDEFRLELQRLRKAAIQPGQIYEFVLKYSKDPLNVNNLFREVIQKSTPQQGIQHGEGYWVDHWIYNLDQLDQFVSVYPDQLQWLIFEKKDFTFHDSDHFVRPRKEKYVVTKNGEFRQFGAVVLNEQKQALILSRKTDAHKVRTNHGTGDIFKTNLFVKLLSLALVKTTSLDNQGAGIEMDAGKPGWCDALNGAPGLFGSSTHEMFELLKLVRFIKEKALPLSPTKSTDIPHEIAHLMKEASSALSHASIKDFRSTWDKMTTAREHYREKVFFGLSGKTRSVKNADIEDFIDRTLRVLEQAEKKATDPKTKLPTSYYTYNVSAKNLSGDWKTHMVKIPWEQHRVAPFLEGPVHAMKLGNLAQCRKIFSAVKKSELADKKLRMYRVNAPLKNEVQELGRIRVFSGGWLENESIFLHMHYKYLLEILRSGLIDEFFTEIKTGWIPFRDMAVYGRPIFENSSFIASSTFPKKEFHGRGFVARLSGATSEYMSMIYHLVFGSRLFVEKEDKVFFSPTPQLPGDWFTKKDSIGLPKNGLQLKLFNVPITFINPKRKNTYGAKSVKPVGYEWILDGRFYTCEGKELPPDPSLALREGRLESLTVFLG